LSAGAIQIEGVDMRRYLLALLCAAVTLVCSIHAEDASAANSLFACFTLGGRAIPISLAGLEATNRYGNWVPIDSVTVTQANGCVSYNLWGTYTRYNLRVVVAGVTPDQTGIVLGVSRFYAPGAYRGRYNLGTWGTTVVRGSLTDSWIDEMDNGSASPSPAAMVAGFSDRLGPANNGSVLCPHSAANDSDCDGVSDTQDSDPYNFRWH
jgi:hypothetical protein